MKDNFIYNIIIMIPCYNEEKNFKRADFLDFLGLNPAVMICFVNDGSKDSTLNHLQMLQRELPHQIEIISYLKNLGKAEAVRTGMLHCACHFNTQRFAFLDADLATPLEECLRVASFLDPPVIFVFGSRFVRLGATIIRRRIRFIIGRVVATAISITLNLKIYDTQCGCKIFNANLVHVLFEEPFLSRWLFDVELFFRMIKFVGRSKIADFAMEVPLNFWEEKGNSKLSLMYGLRLWGELIRMHNKYEK